MANPLSLITQGIKGLADLLSYINPTNDNFILKDVLSWLNPFSDNFILKGVIEFLGNMLSYINPLSDNFFGKKLVDLFSDLLKLLFIPSQERLEAFPNLVSSKFAFIDSIKYAVNSIKDVLNSTGNAPIVTVPVGSTQFTDEGEIEVINLNWYKPFKPYGDLIITAFAYAFFGWRIFVAIPGMINGQSGSTGESYSMVYPTYLSSGNKSLSDKGRRLLK